jgi:YHS domain-containing protein
MVSLFLRILFYLSAVMLLGRFLLAVFTGFQKAKKTTPFPHGHPTAMVKDPVCGIYLDPNVAFRMDHKKEALYFCSNDCRQKFLAKAS